MPAIQSKLFATFPKENLPCIRLPRDIVLKIRSLMRTPMRDFHVGDANLLPTLEETRFAQHFHVRHSAENPKKMVAYLADKQKEFALLAFGRMGPTNFAESPLEVQLEEGLILLVHCVEQLFMLLKLCFIGQDKCPNFEESAINILLAADPMAAKKAGGKIGGYDDEAWKLHRAICMFTSILFACTFERTFDRYKRLVTDCPCPEMAALIAKGLLEVGEFNEDFDWGYGMLLLPFLERLSRAGDFDLNAELDTLPVCPKTQEKPKNLLGNILKHFLLAIRDMTYEQFMDEVKDIRFFEMLPSVDEEELPVAGLKRTFSQTSE